MASQVLLFLCFSPTFSDSQEPPYFFRPQFGTVTVCIYILLAKANYMTKPKISEAGNHTLPVPVLCKATWQRQKGSEGLRTKIQPTYVMLQIQSHRTSRPLIAPSIWVVPSPPGWCNPPLMSCNLAWAPSHARFMSQGLPKRSANSLGLWVSWSQLVLVSFPL